MISYKMFNGSHDDFFVQLSITAMPFSAAELSGFRVIGVSVDSDLLLYCSPYFPLKNLG